MCDPVSLTIAATAMAAVSTGVKTISSLQQESYEAKVDKSNAATQTAAAADAQQRGNVTLQNQYRQASQLKGEQIAAMSANGIDTGFGSALGVQEGTSMLTEQDALTTSKNTGTEMMGHEVSAANYTAKANAAKASETGTAIGGALDFGSTILGGAKQLSALQNPGAWRFASAGAGSGISTSSGYSGGFN